MPAGITSGVGAGVDATDVDGAGAGVELDDVGAEPGGTWSGGAGVVAAACEL